MHFGDAAGADQEIRGETQHRDAQQSQIPGFFSNECTNGLHRRQRVVGRQRDERAVSNVLDERVDGHYWLVPPTVKPSILSVGWPTPTGTLWPSLPHVPMPLSRARSLPIMLTRVSTSGPLPMSVAPFTGIVTLPSSMR